MTAIAGVILAGAHGYIALQTGFIPCTLDCGETYEAHIAALNLDRFGVAFTHGLDDLAASPLRSAHPTLYTHNPNLGTWFLYLLFVLGVRDVHAQAAWVVVPFAAGLLYLYLFVRAISRDATLAALCLLNAGALYLLVALWGFNALRAFSWLLTFGLAYHLYRFARRRRRARLHLAAAMLYMAFAFGIDYPFAVFSATMVLTLGALRLVPVRGRSLVAMVIVGFGAPFVLRQIQVASAIGIEMWWADVVYSALRRIPLVGALATLPDDASLRALYSAHHLVKWPGEGRLALLTWTGRLVRTYWTVVGPPLVLIGLGWVVALIALRRSGARAVVRAGGRPVIAILYVSAAVATGLVVTFVVFGEYVSTFYGVVLMPLVVHWIVLVLGLVSYLLLAHWRASVRVRGRAIPVGMVLLSAFLLWRAGTEIANYRLLPPSAYPGGDALADLRGHSVVTLWISRAASAYTGEWAATLTDARWLALAPGRELAFDPSRDYYFFMEADRQDARYRRPEFLLVPGLNVPALVDRTCRPFGGRIASYADGCADLDRVARRLSWLPLYRRGPDYLLYDLRGTRTGAGARGIGPSSPTG